MDAKKLNMAMTGLKFLVAIIGVGLSIFLFNAPNVTAGTEEVETYRDGSAVFSSAIWFTMITLIALVAFVIIFFLVQLATNTKKTVISIVGILIFAIFYVIMNAAGTADTTDSLLLKNPVEQSVVTTTSAGIYTILVGLGAGILVILIGPFLGRFRK